MVLLLNTKKNRWIQNLILRITRRHQAALSKSSLVFMIQIHSVWFPKVCWTYNPFFLFNSPLIPRKLLILAYHIFAFGWNIDLNWVFHILITICFDWDRKFDSDCIHSESLSIQKISRCMNHATKRYQAVCQSRITEIDWLSWQSTNSTWWSRM